MLHERGAHVTGIDVSDGMLAKARKSSTHRRLNIDYMNMNVHDLGFKAHTFDHVFSMAAVEFIPDTALAFRNIHRVLKPGGTAVIGTIHKGSAWADFYESDAFAQTVFAQARFKQLDDFMALSGFEVAASKECLFVPPGRNDEQYTIENEKKEEQNNSRGGFLCVKMIKR